MNNIQLESPVEIFSHIELPGQLYSTISVPQDSTLTLLNQQSLNLSMEVQELHSVLTIGQGPAGISAEEEVKYSKRTDFVGEDIIYRGEAIPGSNESDPVWRIWRITFAGEDVLEHWADGTAEFNKKWSDRVVYSYR